MITSLKNPRINAAVRLRDGRHRQKQGATLVDGARELLRALEAGLRPVEVFYCRPLCRSDEARAALDRLAALGTELVEVSEAVFEKLAFGNRAEGLIAVLAAQPAPLAALALGQRPLVAVLEAAEKPGNLGAIVRSADGAGVTAVVAAELATDLYNPNAIRASLGTLFTLPVAAASSAETLAWLIENGLAVYAARVDAERLYYEVDYRGPSAIVLGSEADGLSRIWHDSAVVPVRLPMLGRADSLNVSASAAVFFYEARRQRAADERR